MNKPQPTGPISEKDLLDSLQFSGFPLEMRLLEAFSQGGFDPSPAHRFVLGEGDKERSAEVDVLARAMEILADNKGMVLLLLMVEAKQFKERKAFVGFTWKPLTPHERRSARQRFCGLPTSQVLRHGPNGGRFEQFLLGGDDPAMAALDGLNDLPLCYQWTVARDHKSNAFVDSSLQDDKIKESIDKLVRVSTWYERATALQHLRARGNPSIMRVQVVFPTVVIATPHLYTYDAQTKDLTKTQALTVRRMHEVGGEVHLSHIDVVTEDEVSAHMKRVREAAQKLRDAFDRGAWELGNIVNEQQAAQEKLDQEAKAKVGR